MVGVASASESVPSVELSSSVSVSGPTDINVTGRRTGAAVSGVTGGPMTSVSPAEIDIRLTRSTRPSLGAGVGQTRLGAGCLIHMVSTTVCHAMAINSTSVNHSHVLRPK